MKKILLVASCSVFVLVSRSQIAITSDRIPEQVDTRAKLIYFIGNMSDNRILLKWNVAENECVNLFEITKSYDGKNFTTSGFILASEKKGNETYVFPELVTEQQKLYYRLKIIGNNQKVKYSRVISLQPSFLEKILWPVSAMPLLTSWTPNENFMKQIHTVLYSMYEIIMYFIVAIMLVSLSIIIITNSWHYLLLFIPALWYMYKSRTIKLRKNKHIEADKKS